jgi:hypothetical protein
MNGFLLGRGCAAPEPSGRLPPLKAAKLDGVSSLPLAGGGRPVTLAMRVRIQRMIVKMPSTDPSVWRRLPNCSATDTIATIFVSGHLFRATHVIGEQSHTEEG